MEFSKIIVIAISILTVLISGFSMFAMIYVGDLSALPVLITAIFAAFATGTGFYYNKAKAENLKKLAKSLKQDNIDVNDVQAAKELLNDSDTSDTHYV